MGNKVNKTTYILLAIFLGSFGIHQFYAKRVKSGFLYLIFSWTMIPGILGIYDAIKAGPQNKDSDGKITILEKQNKLIPIIVATAIVVLSLIFAPKTPTPEVTKSEPVKIEKKVKNEDEKVSEKESSTSSSSKKETKPSKETTVSSTEEPFDPASYPLVDFNAWNHDDVEYASKLQVTGTVIQAMKSDKGMNLRLAINDDYDQVVLITIEDTDYQDVIAEDDNVTVYGLNAGLTSYKTVMGNEQTIPAMLGTNYTVNSYGQ